MLGGIEMKNREKYRDEIVEVLKEDNEPNGKMCCFVKDNVIPRFVSEEDMEVCAFGGMNCHTCSKMFAFWLDEEYEEPPKPEVDWSKVPVDTLVWVRDDENDKWYLRYFKGTEDSALYRFVTWESGATSITAYDSVENWKYCELVEDDDGSNQD